MERLSFCTTPSRSRERADACAPLPTKTPPFPMKTAADTRQYAKTSGGLRRSRRKLSELLATGLLPGLVRCDSILCAR